MQTLWQWHSKEKKMETNLGRILPLFAQLEQYDRASFGSDLIAGLIVAIMLIPQGMAYAVLAGLPPAHGLYASMIPIILYGMFGTSRQLAIGPVAIISLLTASSVGALAAEGSADYLQIAITLALMVGVIQFAMGLMRAGFLVNFLSHPVLSGFISAAALVIGVGQVKNLLGLTLPRTHYFYQQLWEIGRQLLGLNLATTTMGLLSLATLWFFKTKLRAVLTKLLHVEWIIDSLVKMGPLLVVLVSTIVVASLRLDERAGVAVVGYVPSGLPSLTMPSIDYSSWRLLLPTALAISFVGYMESISVAKSLAARRRQKVASNQELVAIGLANLGAAFTGGYPVAGGFGRSLVNYSAGARSSIASIVTAILIAISLLFLTPIFYYIPTTVLAAIIMAAVAGLFEGATMVRVWRFNRRDGVALLITFFSVLIIGIESGILVGAFSSLLLFIARTSNPHTALVGRLPNSSFYRNVERHRVETWPDVALLRIDASLYFANGAQVEDRIAGIVASNDELKYLVLIGTAINDIDYSAVEILEETIESLTQAGIELHLAAFKGPVLEQLERAGILAKLGAARVHLTTHDAMLSIKP